MVTTQLSGFDEVKLLGEDRWNTTNESDRGGSFEASIEAAASVLDGAIETGRDETADEFESNELDLERSVDVHDATASPPRAAAAAPEASRERYVDPWEPLELDVEWSFFDAAAPTIPR
jgi:hypothetical protein